LPAQPGPAIPLEFMVNMFRTYFIDCVFALPDATVIGCFLAASAYQALVANLEINIF
jgi:hypothetical protein